MKQVFKPRICWVCKKEFSPKSTRTGHVCSPRCLFVTKISCFPVGCCEWYGEITKEGVAMLRYAGKSYRAQHFAYTYYFKEDTKNCIVFTSCGKKNCVSPCCLLKKERSNHLDSDSITLAKIVRDDKRGHKQIARDLDLPLELVAYYRSPRYGVAMTRAILKKEFKELNREL